MPKARTAAEAGFLAIGDGAAQWPTGDHRGWTTRVREKMASAVELATPHGAGRIVRGGRRLRLRIAATWPWATQITTAITRLQALAPR
jgi:hypothetical protein